VEAVSTAATNVTNQNFETNENERNETRRRKQAQIYLRARVCVCVSHLVALSSSFFLFEGWGGGHRLSGPPLLRLLLSFALFILFSVSLSLSLIFASATFILVAAAAAGWWCGSSIFSPLSFSFSLSHSFACPSVGGSLPLLGVCRTVSRTS